MKHLILDQFDEDIGYEKSMNVDECNWNSGIHDTDALCQKAYIKGLERGREISIDLFDSMDPTIAEIEYMCNEVEKLVCSLMDIIERLSPEEYHKSDVILKCDKWLKWANEESDAVELKEFFGYEEK